MGSCAQGPGGKGLVVKTAGGKAYDTDMAMLVIGGGPASLAAVLLMRCWTAGMMQVGVCVSGALPSRPLERRYAFE